MMPKPQQNIELSMESQQVEMLAAENIALRKAGAKLAMAALHVCSEYDGLHRLALAVSEWSKVMADENGRGVRYTIDRG